MFLATAISATTTPEAGEAAAAGFPPFLLIPVGIIVLWIGLGFLWNRKYRPARQKAGVAVASFNNILGRVLKFVFIEDKYPALKKNEEGELTDELKYPKFGKFLVWRNFYIAGVILATILSLTKNDGAIWLWLALFFVIAGRTSNVFSARHAVLTRMFEVAAVELRYPRDANLNPWGWVNIKKWERLTIPGDTDVKFPPAYKSEEQKNRENFERHFNGTVTDDNTWLYKWQSSKSVVSCAPVTHIPSYAPYPGSSQGKWNEIPIGLGTEGTVVWDVAVAPHALVTGTTGGGKSTIQRNLIFHCIQHSDRWRFLGIDVKRVELSPFVKYDPVVMGIATNVADGVEIIRYANEEMMNRYEQMEQLGVNHFKDLPEMPYALMVMIDESYMFLAPSGIKTDEAKEEDALKGEASKAIGDIARLGRAAGVHLVLATQRPDATVIYGELKQNLAARIAAGRMDSIASSMTLDNDNATRLPGNIKGRGYFQTFGEGEQFQGFFAPQDWIDKWLAGEDPDGKDGPAEAEAPARKKERKSIMNWKKEPNVPEIAADYTEDESNTPKKKKRGGLLGKLDAYNEIEEQMQSEDASDEGSPQESNSSSEGPVAKPVAKEKKFPFGKKETPAEASVATESSDSNGLFDDDPFADDADDPFAEENEEAPLIEVIDSGNVDKSSLLNEIKQADANDEFVDPFGDIPSEPETKTVKAKESPAEDDSFFFDDDDFSLFDGNDGAEEEEPKPIIKTKPEPITPAKEEPKKTLPTRPGASQTAQKPSSAPASLPALPGLPARPQRPVRK